MTPRLILYVVTLAAVVFAATVEAPDWGYLVLIALFIAGQEHLRRSRQKDIV